MSEKVYVIANFEINNPEEFRNYEKGFFGILKKHGGEFITFDDAPDKIEGKGLSGRVAMWTFNSKDEFYSIADVINPIKKVKYISNEFREG